MKKLKKITYGLLMFSVILSACGKKDEEDAARLNELNEQVENLYNEEMDDLSDELLFDQLEDADENIQSVKEEELSEENTETLENIDSLYQNAELMFDLEREIQEIFVDEVVKEEVEFKDIEKISDDLTAIDQEKWTAYTKKQEEQLEEAESQLEKIETAKKRVDELYVDDDKVDRETSREDEKEAKEAVSKVKNKKIQKKLEERLEKVDKTLTKVEEEERLLSTVGDFAGLYHEEKENYLIKITEDEHSGFIPHSGISFTFEILEILKHTENELTLKVYEEPIDNEIEYTEGGTYEISMKFLEDKDHVQLESSMVIRRVSEEEYEDLKDPFGWN